MSVEFIAALVMVTVLTLVVGAAHLDTQRGHRLVEPALLSTEDRRLLCLLRLTRGEWLSLTSQQQENMRERAYRGMD